MTKTELENHKQQLINILNKYVPQAASTMCAEIIMHYRLHLHIETERKTKYGDYAPHLGMGNRITVNHNLSPFEFLFTFIHELAHHTTYLKYGPYHQSHGKEWKNEFKICMRPFIEADIFPHDLKLAIINHMKNPKYSHSADIHLLRVLKKYDTKNTYKVLDSLPDGAVFKMKNSDVLMQKKHKLRTYYFCINIHNKKPYKVHAMAEVVECKTNIKPG